VSGTNLEAIAKFLLPTDICRFVDVDCSHSVERRFACSLQLLLGLASSVFLGFESCKTHDQILLSKIRDSPNLKGKVPVFIYPRNRVIHVYINQLSGFPVALELLSNLSKYNFSSRTDLDHR
jgi:hypothetical protein